MKFIFIKMQVVDTESQLEKKIGLLEFFGLFEENFGL